MLVIKTDTTVSGDFDYIEKDYRIIRSVTTGFVDFSNSETFDADYSAINVPSGTAVHCLTDGATDGVTSGVIPAYTNAITLADDVRVDLPAAQFKHATDGSVDHAVQIFWVKLAKDGYPNTSQKFGLIAGDDNTTGDNYGGLFFEIESLTDDAEVTKVNWIGYGDGIELDAAHRELLHAQIIQLAFVFKSNGDGTATTSYYIDNELKKEATTVYTDDFADGGAGYSIGDGGAFSQILSTGITVGCLNFANLTGTSVDAAEYIARDWNFGHTFYGR